MVNQIIKLILIGLIIFTPIAFGSIELWAFSVMELAILLIIILWAIQFLIRHVPRGVHGSPEPYMVQGAFPLILLSLLLCLVLFQIVPLPSGILKIISPKTYELRSALSFEPSALSFKISFVPFLTQIEFFKWFALIVFFLFLLSWKVSNRKFLELIPVIMLVGIGESLYGVFEFFSGHRHILHLEASSLVSSVTGTFLNRNHFAGYLLMVIPLSVGYLFSREAFRKGQIMDWRHRISALDGKTLLIVFGIILMILGLLFSASRMGIVGLLLSFSLISLLFRGPKRGKMFSRASILIFGLAVLWAAWIGLDAVISRFFTVSEDFQSRWMIWANTLQIVKDFPILGSGLGTFTQVFPMYRSFHIRGLVTHAENEFLQLASEIGLLGLGFLAAAFLYFFFKSVSGIRSLPSRDLNRYIGIGGMVGILALMFHSVVEKNIQVPANAILFTFIWALVLRICSTKMLQNGSP